MKKHILFVLILLMAACTADESVAPKKSKDFRGIVPQEGLPTLQEAQSNDSPEGRVQCPQFRTWALSNAVWDNTGGFETKLTFNIYVRNPITDNRGIYGPSYYTMRLTNLGNMPMAYKRLSIESWHPLAVGAFVDVTLNLLPSSPCLTNQSPQGAHTIYLKATDCPLGSGSPDNIWSYSYKIQSVDPLHQIAASPAPTEILFLGHYNIPLCTL